MHICFCCTLASLETQHPVGKDALLHWLPMLLMELSPSPPAALLLDFVQKKTPQWGTGLPDHQFAWQLALFFLSNKRKGSGTSVPLWSLSSPLYGEQWILDTDIGGGHLPACGSLLKRTEEVALNWSRCRQKKELGPGREDGMLPQ